MANESYHLLGTLRGNPRLITNNKTINAFWSAASCLQVSMLITVTVEKNGKPLGHRLVKCESRMRELDQLLRSSDNPLQFMCQVSNTILILVFTFYFLFTSYSTESKGFARFEQPNQSKVCPEPPP